MTLMMPPEVPAASADTTDHADWLELTALMSRSGLSSMSDLIAAMTRTGSVDGASPVDDLDDDEPLGAIVEKENDRAEQVANDAFNELGLRKQYLGETYPFDVGATLEASPDAEALPYTFLLALTHLTNADRPAVENGPSLFEQVSRSALVRYLGGPTRVGFCDFGWPRRDGPSAFHDALIDLCQRMGEGTAPKQTRSATRRIKDAKLDLVAWVSFGDARTNQLSVFGQCTAANRWEDKIDELQPQDFCQRWLKEAPAMSPVAAFFVPQRVADSVWRVVAIGERRILFDRLRIASLLADLDADDADLAARCTTWTRAAILNGE